MTTLLQPLFLSRLKESEFRSILREILPLIGVREVRTKSPALSDERASRIFTIRKIFRYFVYTPSSF
jgi:hypothetical protein